MGCPAAIDGDGGRSMNQSVRVCIVSLSQLLLAYIGIREWLVTRSGWSLLQAVFFGVMAIAIATLGYVKRNSPTIGRADPRVLRRIASVGGVAGAAALIALLLRVHGEWIRLGEQANLWLAMVVILGLVSAAFAALELRQS
jgi:hypothetical protein